MKLTLHAGDGDKKARSPGRARRKPLKPFAQGMPHRFGSPVVTTCVFLHTKLRARRSARHSLRPSIFEGRYSGKTRVRKRRGNFRCVCSILRDASPKGDAPQDEVAQVADKSR